MKLEPIFFTRHIVLHSLKRCVTRKQPRMTVLLATCFRQNAWAELWGTCSRSISVKYERCKQRCDTVWTSAILLVKTNGIIMTAMLRSNIKLLLFGICLLTDTCLFTALSTVVGIEGKLFCVIHEIVVTELVCKV